MLQRATGTFKRYRITGTGSRSATSSDTHSGFSITTDVPEVMGGTNTSAEPIYHLLAAFIGCETATAQFVAKHMKIKIAKLEFDLTAERDAALPLLLPIETSPSGNVGLFKIMGTVSVETIASQEQIHKLFDQVHTRCPVASMLVHSGCELDLKYKTI